MHITRIEIEGFGKAGPDGLRHGSVALEADGNRVQIPLSLPDGYGALGPRHRMLLLAQALNRIRRLPEFRSRGSLTFAPGLLPDRLRRLSA